ncbi:MAG: hypothetical protein FWE32_11595 [Oscillospiraceae bacterium]|nr:hypothetical protein [Oscillospiraceae bacterium]
MKRSNPPGPDKKPVSGQPTPTGRPRTKEEAIMQEIAQDPERAAQLLRELLKKK